MKRLSYLLFSILLFCSCEKPDTNYSIVGEWNLYSSVLKELVIDTAASAEETTAIRDIITGFHAREDSTISVDIVLTSDNRYFQDGKEIGTYDFQNSTFTIFFNIDGIEGKSVYDSVFLNKSHHSYIVDRTLFFKSLSLIDSEVPDSLNFELVQKVRTKYSFKRK